MNKSEVWLAEVNKFISSLDPYFTEPELKETKHLIEHGEPAEGLRTLAYIIVEEKKMVPEFVIDKIRKYSNDLISTEDLPANLDSYRMNKK